MGNLICDILFIVSDREEIKVNLKMKLIITFTTVIAVPLFLITIIFMGFMSMQPAGVVTPQTKEFLIEMLLSVLLIMAMTSSFLVVWIYRSILNPIETLKKATRNIRDGNLDFEVAIEDTDEIGELCADFEEMRIRLKESTEQKVSFDSQNKELISNISHDLKTPITAIKGYVEGLLDGVADTPQKQEKYLRTIYNKANDMDRLINELSFYSKIDTNRIPYNFNKINVLEYFDDCIEDIGLELDEQHVQLSYNNEVSRDIVVIADAEQLKRVINNIVGNSVKYMDKNDKFIQIRVLDVGDFVQVEIEDNGKGIAAKDLPYIYDRFYRTDTSRNSSKGGSGIGLSIVHKIMEDHGGKVWATSKEGSGTTMYFVLRKYQEVPVNE
ncbi:MAG: HAMP domain-containing histidine kinase [Lachnospiraceae bacterium]|nr:HAMP domain-containing histidine kinase [Lachnospiraceae bacterium]